MYVFNFTAIKGDTFKGTYIFQILKNSVPLDLTDVQIDAQFKITAKGEAALSMSTEDDTIIVTDAVAGKFAFAKQIIDIEAGKYLYDVQLTYPIVLPATEAEIETVLKGTMTVEQDITKLTV